MYTPPNPRGIITQTVATSELGSLTCCSWCTPSTDRRSQSRVLCQSCMVSRFTSWHTSYSGKQAKTKRQYNTKCVTEEATTKIRHFNKNQHTGGKERLLKIFLSPYFYSNDSLVYKLYLSCSQQQKTNKPLPAHTTPNTPL